MKVCLLAGGTGAAKLAVGLQAVLPPGGLTVIANTADDEEIWGVHVSPDVDMVLYRLAGIFNEVTGFGVDGDTFTAFEMMGRLGGLDWFRLGDRDLAVNLLRTEMLRRGASQTRASLELGRRLGLSTRVLPMSDDRVRTVFTTEKGRLSFQEYFVREKLRPRLDAVEFEGLEGARPSDEVREALAGADLVIIGPSNPVISIGPILAVAGGAVDPGRTLAVSPIVGGRSLKGPTVEMMAALGRPAGVAGVAREYQGRAGRFVLDELDRAVAPAVEQLGFGVMVTDTVMADGGERLATTILDSIGQLR